MSARRTGGPVKSQRREGSRAGGNTNTRTLFCAMRSLAGGKVRTSDGEKEREREHRDERAGESVEQPRRWAEGQAILQRSQDARGDLRQK